MWENILRSNMFLISPSASDKVFVHFLKEDCQIIWHNNRKIHLFMSFVLEYQTRERYSRMDQVKIFKGCIP